MSTTLAYKPLRVKLFQKIMGLAAGLQSIPARMTPPPFRLLQIGSLFWQSRALYVAARLGIADALGRETKEVSELAAELRLDEDHLFRLLRMLCALGVFEQSGPRRFRNSKTSDYLRSDHPKTVRAMVLMHNSPEMTAPWLEPLEEAIRDGGVPFAKVHGAELFDYMDGHREFDLLFGQAMDSVENLTGDDYLDDLDWSTFDRIIDVGGSKGSKAAAILRRQPRLRALVFDRPQIIEAAKAQWQERREQEVGSRMSFEGGNMFEYIPAAQSERDVYLFVAIFHGMADGECLQVLERLRSAMGEHRACAVFVDMVMGETRPDPTTAAFDMQMLVNTRGRERTRAEWNALFTQGGFSLEEVVPARTFPSFIVVRPL
jgi:hypothetical protein